MKKGILYFLIAVVTILFSSCAGTMKTFDLNEEYATTLHYEGTLDEGKKVEAEDEKSDLVGVPVLGYYGGNLKRGAIWWTGEGISLEKGDVFIFEAENVGPDSIPFGATFPPLDLIKEKVVLKISARAEGKEGDLPTLYLQVDDANGYKANAKRPSQKIENSEEFKDYIFDMRDIYAQSIPTKHKVNGAMINSLKFFINPGLQAYTGIIYIKEITVIPAPAEK